MSNKLLFILICLPAIAGLVWFCYVNGFMCIGMRRALLFVDGFSGKKASFKGCTGHSLRVLPLGRGPVTVCFDAAITKGSMRCEVFSKDKTVFFSLTPNKKASFTALPGTRYYAKLYFDHADGRYELTVK